MTNGTGPNSIVITLMDADGDAEVVELVSVSGTGSFDGLEIFYENMGTFYFRVEGPEVGWTIWVRN